MIQADNRGNRTQLKVDLCLQLYSMYLHIEWMLYLHSSDENNALMQQHPGQQHGNGGVYDDMTRYIPAVTQPTLTVAHGLISIGQL